MKLRFAAALAVAALVALNTTSADAVNTPLSVTTAKSAIAKIACTGDRRTYTDFAHCMRVNTGGAGAKYCSKICS